MQLTSLLIFLYAGATGAIEPASNARLDEIASKGRQIMPFSLERTLHIFSKTEQGGVQQVIAKNTDDSNQIALIRRHLMEIAEQFGRGDFSGPASIHGADMPGLAILQSAESGALNIGYRELPNGAELIYTSEQVPLIDAVHLWFDAQLKDHARHAMEHYRHHLMRQQQ